MHDFFASIDCRTRIVTFNFSNEIVLEWNGGNSVPTGCIISCIKACQIIPKGCLYHIVRFKDLDSQNPHIELVPVVRKFPEVHPNDLPRIPPKWEINFSIGLIPDTNPISIPLYQMAPTKWKDLKSQLEDLLDKTSLDVVSFHGVL